MDASMEHSIQGRFLNFEYPAAWPFDFHDITDSKQVANFPLPGPGAVTTTIGFVVSNIVIFSQSRLLKRFFPHLQDNPRFQHVYRL